MKNLSINSKEDDANQNDINFENITLDCELFLCSIFLNTMSSVLKGDNCDEFRKLKKSFKMQDFNKKILEQFIEKRLAKKIDFSVINKKLTFIDLIRHNRTLLLTAISELTTEILNTLKNEGAYVETDPTKWKEVQYNPISFYGAFLDAALLMDSTLDVFEEKKIDIVSIRQNVIAIREIVASQLCVLFDALMHSLENKQLSRIYIAWIYALSNEFEDALDYVLGSWKMDKFWNKMDDLLDEMPIINPVNEHEEKAELNYLITAYESNIWCGLSEFARNKIKEFAQQGKQLEL